MYTIQKLAQLAGVSTRTLRYYDDIGLLKPARLSDSGYRLYGTEEVDQLQLILFYRALDFSLEDIGKLMTSPTFDRKHALMAHRENLLQKRKQLDLLIDNVEQTISTLEGMMTMNDHQKFEGFKKALIDENEKKYGTEIRAKYGDDMINNSNKKVMGLTKDQHQHLEQLSNKLLSTFAEAMESGDPSCHLAQEAADLHRQWICHYWDTYTKEAHAGIAEMYVADERFADYYNKVKPGMAQFVKDAIVYYAAH